MALPGQKRLAANDRGQTEYGGRKGLIQSIDDGHEMDIAEQAMVLRVHNLLGGADDDFRVEPEEPTMDNVGTFGAGNKVIVDEKRNYAAGRVAGKMPEDVTDVENLA